MITYCSCHIPVKHTNHLGAKGRTFGTGKTQFNLTFITIFRDNPLRCSRRASDGSKIYVLIYEKK